MRLEQELIRSGVRGGQIEGQACGHVEPEGAVWVHMAPEERGQRPLLGDAHVARRDRTQLSLDRARGGPEQEYRSRYRQTTSDQDGSDRVTATLRPVTRMLGLGQDASFPHLGGWPVADSGEDGGHF